VARHKILCSVENCGPYRSGSVSTVTNYLCCSKQCRHLQLVATKESCPRAHHQLSCCRCDQTMTTMTNFHRLPDCLHTHQQLLFTLLY